MAVASRIFCLFPEQKNISIFVAGGKSGMPHNFSRRHKRLMDESEQALLDAIADKTGRQSSIAKYVLNDRKTHLNWEVRHAELVRPVAEQKKRTPQVFALRNIEMRLVHKRALIDHIRTHNLRGRKRNQMFAAIYGPRDLTDAILTEHRRYMVAVSSDLSADHLIDVMYDPLGKRLLKNYRRGYAYYFDLYGQVVRCSDPALANATKSLMFEAGNKLATLRSHIRTARPDNSYANFDRQALLAYSGRQPILEYMVG